MEKYRHIHGHSWYYRTMGSGTPVVLIHGFCTYGHIWDPLLMLLEDDMRLLIPDLPGFGLSATQASISIADFATQLLAILDVEEIDSAIFIGHSMGGYIAMQIAGMHPERVLGLGLIHSHVYADSAEKKENRLKAVRFIEANGTLSYIQNFVPGLFSESTDRRVVKAEIAALSEQDPLGLQAALQAMANREDAITTMEKLQVPVLFVQGRHDTLLSTNQLLAQSALPVTSMVYVLQNAAHMGMLEQATDLAAALNAYYRFLDGKLTS